MARADARTANARVAWCVQLSMTQLCYYLAFCSYISIVGRCVLESFDVGVQRHTTRLVLQQV
jgi:hypothetical protein